MSTFSRLPCFSARAHYPVGRPPFDLSLYLVANRPSFHNEQLFFSKIEAAIRGGVSCVQLRDHESDFSTACKTASQLKNMLNGTPLFINTLKPFELVQEIDADGIYLEEPFPHSEARKLLGGKKIIGAPVKTMEDVVSMKLSPDIDYLSVKISPSKKTCPRNDQLWGMEGLRTIRSMLPYRIVAIGGLHLECAGSVYRELHPDDGIAMAGGLMGERDPCITAQKIQEVRQRIRASS